MGNGQYRYLTNNDAVEIIGSKVWTELRVKLEKHGSRTLDFELFRAILLSRFERMVRTASRMLFRITLPLFCHNHSLSTSTSLAILIGV